MAVLPGRWQKGLARGAGDGGRKAHPPRPEPARPRRRPGRPRTQASRASRVRIRTALWSRATMREGCQAQCRQIVTQHQSRAGALGRLALGGARVLDRAVDSRRLLVQAGGQPDQERWPAQVAKSIRAQAVPVRQRAVPAEDSSGQSKVVPGRIDLVVHGGGAKRLEQGLAGRLDHLQVALGSLFLCAVTNPGAPS